MSNTRNADFTIADAVTLELVSRQLTQITDGLAILSDQVKRLIDNETARDLKVDNAVKRVGRLEIMGIPIVIAAFVIGLLTGNAAPMMSILKKIIPLM